MFPVYATHTPCLLNILQILNRRSLYLHIYAKHFSNPSHKCSGTAVMHAINSTASNSVRKVAII